MVTVIAETLAGLATLTAAAAFWLATNPVSVDTLLPHVQAAVPAPYTIDADALNVQFGEWPIAIELVARQVQLGRSTDMIAIARIPELRLGVDAAALLSGEILPTSLRLVAPRLLVTRGTDGRVVAGLMIGDSEAPAAVAPAPPATAEAGEQGLLPRVVVALQPGDTAPSLFSRLQHVEIADAAVTYVDRRHSFSWRIPDLHAAVRRTDAGVRGEVLFSLPDAGAGTGVTAAFTHNAADGAEIDADIHNIVPSTLAEIDPVLAPLVALASPVSLSLDLSMTPDLQPVAGNIGATGRDVVLQAPGLYHGPVVLPAIETRVAVDFVGETLTLATTRLDLGGPTVDGGARVAWDETSIRMVADATVADLPMGQLPVWWPPALNDNARRWVEERMGEPGTVIAASLGLETHAARDAPLDVTVVTTDAAILYEGLQVDYLPGLPPVTEIDGSAIFDGERLAFAIDRARLEDIAIDGGTVVISEFDQRPERIAIDLGFAGDISAALAVIDRQPLGYASALGLAPETVAGPVTGRIGFDFPLRSQLSLDDVAVEVAAGIEGVSIARLLDGLPIRGLVGDLTVDNDGMTYQGRAVLADNPLTVRWAEAFSAAATPRRTVSLSGPVDLAGLAMAGDQAGDVLDGPVGLALTVVDSGRDALEAEITADLTPAAVTVSALDYRKPAGAEGRMTARVRRRDDRTWGIEELRLSLPDLAAEGQVTLDADGGFLHAQLDRVEHHGQVLATQVTRRTGGYTVGLNAQELDLSQFIDLDGAFDPATADAATTDDAADGPPVWLTARIGTLRLGGDRALNTVQASANLHGAEVRSLDLDGLSGAAAIAVRYGPQDDGRDQLTLQADDAGALLAALDLWNGVSGGRLRITAVGADGAWSGNARMEGAHLTSAPLLARLLAAGSLFDINERLAAGGLTFDVIEAGFALTPGRLTLSDGRAAGGALGLTAEGGFDRTDERIDLTGTIVPFVGVNRVLEGIPVLGTLLTGGEDQGLFALTYQVSGPMDEPDIAINPLSALAPGVLRRILFGGGPEGRPTAVSERDDNDR